MTTALRAHHAGPRPAGGVVLGAFGCTKAPSFQEVVLLALAYSSDEWLSHSQRVVLRPSFLTVDEDSTTAAFPAFGKRSREEWCQLSRLAMKLLTTL
jgi:hypothetical protein